MKSELKEDLARLSELAYHRLETGGETVRKFHRLKKRLKEHPDFPLLEKTRHWILAPVTLWPMDIQGAMGQMLEILEGGKCLDPNMRLLVELLSPPPDAKVQEAVRQHEHAVQYGKYESLISANCKFDSVAAGLAEDPKFQSDWQAIKARFDVGKYQDYKGIIRRTAVSERSMRFHSGFQWKTQKARFHSIFDSFCQRWDLYGMEYEKPLLLKLTANLTPFGTMIFIPAYWSFDPKRDLEWKNITALHKARGVQKQGPKLFRNRAEQADEAKRARQLWTEAGSSGLKGLRRSEWVMEKLGWDVRNDVSKLRRLLK